jgi:hypothetical protein
MQAYQTVEVVRPSRKNANALLSSAAAALAVLALILVVAHVAVVCQFHVKLVLNDPDFVLLGW